MPLLIVAFLAVFAANFVLGLTGASSPILTFCLGATTLAIGTMLALNLRGVAAHHSTYLKTHRVRGVDYSGSYVANPLYVRLSGVAMAIVGAVFIIVSTTS